MSLSQAWRVLAPDQPRRFRRVARHHGAVRCLSRNQRQLPRRLGALMLTSIRSQPNFLFIWLPRALITGVGVGLVLPSLSGAAVQGLPAARFAVGSAVNQAVRQMAWVLGVASVIALLGARSGAALLVGFERICALLIAGGLLTAAVSLRLQPGVRCLERKGARQRRDVKRFHLP